MERILLAMDANTPGDNAFQFAHYLARVTKAKITGVFLKEMELKSAPVFYKEWQPSNTLPAEKTITTFRQQCLESGLNHNCISVEDFPVTELTALSLYADLLIIDKQMALNKYWQGYSTEFLEAILKKAECPVTIAPAECGSIDEVVFLYDGDPASVGSLKAFLYLFPQFYNKRVILLNIRSRWKAEEKYMLKEWLGNLLIDMHFEHSGEDPVSLMKDYSLSSRRSFLVTGISARTKLLDHIKRADDTAMLINDPVFLIPNNRP